MPPRPLTATAPSPADVERIAALADPIQRNLQITQAYHDLARAFAARVAGDANWCAHATWASKQAGQTIRGEDLRAALEHVLERSSELEPLLRAVVAHARALGSSPELADVRRVVRETVDPEAIIARTSDAVARGNQKVFGEIAREFARFLAERFADTEADQAAIASFAAGTGDGESPQGRPYLRRAFTHCYRALFEPDAKARSEWLLLANLEIGVHEQARVQPEILAALDAPVLDADQLRSRIVARLLPRQAGWLARARALLRGLFGGPTPLDVALGELVERVRRELRRVITEHLMTLTLPGSKRLHLGADLGGAFPAALAHLANPELVALLARIDPTPDSLRGTGATDWGSLDQRVHYIADLFRRYQAAPELFDAPFDAETTAAIRAARTPAATG